MFEQLIGVRTGDAVGLLLAITFSILSIYYIASNAIQMFFIVLSFREYGRTRIARLSVPRIGIPESQMPVVSIIIPAFNEAPVIRAALTAVTEIDYPHLEVIVIDDGSTDGTSEAVITAWSMEQESVPRYSGLSKAEIGSHWRSATDPRFRLIQQANRGKSAAMNTALDHATGELVVTQDADTLPEPDSLRKIVPHFLHRPKLIGASGVVRILNGSVMEQGHVPQGRLPYAPFPLFQILEYIRAFYVGRLSLDSIGGTILLAGAFSMFRRAVLVEVGGFDETSVCEDLELVVRIRERFAARPGTNPVDFRIIPEAICWTQAPARLRHLRQQRLRWQAGMIDTLLKHRGLLFNTRAGVTGWFVLPYILLFQVLSPVIDFTAISLLLYVHFANPFELLTHRYFMLVLISGALFSWFSSLIAIHWAELRFRRHPGTLHFFPFMFRAFQFASASLVEMPFHLVLQTWNLECLFRFPFLRGRWGDKPRQALPLESPQSS